ncbi:MAG: hypothetical protein KDA87_23745 [Planctomycetales bacterium]|nr:hypothetical protein [Planctomycetales bacterium]
MDALNKWAERVYTETDFARSIATTVAGVIGLSVYLRTSDWTIAAFSSIIAFPAIRLISSGFHQKANRALQRRHAHEEFDYQFSQLSENEQKVACAFVGAGGSVMTYSQVNQMALNNSAIESLIRRELLSTSLTADDRAETFVLDSNVFDAAQRHVRSTNGKSGK